MLDRLPFGLGEHRLERNRHIAQHVDREGQHVGEQLLVGGAHVIAFRHDGQCGESHHADHRYHNAGCPAGQRIQLALPCHETAGGEQHAQQHACDAEHGERAQQQREIDGGEITFPDRALDQRRSVIAEHLQEALAPTQALTPALREGDRLLVVQDGGAAVADAVAVQHAVHGEFQILGE